MKSSELRIGNHVRNNFHPNSQNFKIQKVIRIDDPLIGIVSVSYLPTKQLISIENIAGIQLTEKWLLDFRFKPHAIERWHKCTKFYPNENGGRSCKIYCIGLSTKGEGYPIWEKGFEIKNGIRYVHELQNLWYWLTRNEELTLKP